MEKSIVSTGKTIDLAIAAAMEQLGLDRDSISVEVLEKPKSGFLGIGSQPARIKATYEVPDEPPKPALSSASRSKPKKAPAPEQTAKVIAPAAPAKPQQPKQERPLPKQENRQPKADRPAEPKQENRQPRPEKSRDQKPYQPRQPKPEKKEQPAAPKAPAEPKVYAVAEPGSLEERIEQFVKGLLEHMGSEAVPHAYKADDETYMVDLVGESLGALIGRRGDTLDAIQHLTNYAVNRGQTKRMRINVDAENYRQKREEALQHLAQKVAGKVVKYRRNITLESMNAYERHVIHAALQDSPNVTTFSTGSEPNRRVVVAYNRDKGAQQNSEE